MPDVALTVLVDRTLLGLAPLDLNNGFTSRIGANNFLGGMNTWKRNQIGSPYMSGLVTTSRTLDMVTEQYQVEVYGRTSASPTRTAAQLQANYREIVAALYQDNFTFTVIIDGVTYQYEAETADYKITWTTPRLAYKQGLMDVSMPRQPIPLAGGV